MSTPGSNARSMSLRLRIVLGLLVAAGACTVDQTITHGADGAPEWERRLSAAVAIGVPLDSARAIMLRNGFRCEAGADSVRYLWCDKMGGGRFAIARRRWQAVLSLGDRNRIARVRATTGLVLGVP